MPCRLLVGQSDHTGLVLDLSPSGLFIQTSAKVTPGQQVQVILSDPSGESIELFVEIARRKAVPARLLSVAQGGIGVRILNAPERFYTFLSEVGILGGRSSPKGESQPRFRLRVNQGSRTKRLEVEAADAEEAERIALEELGEGWKVLAVEALD